MKNPRFLSAAVTVALGGSTLAAIGATPAHATEPVATGPSQAPAHTYPGITTLSVDIASGALEFPDVAGGHYAKADIDWASSNGVIIGHHDGSFRPDESLGRAWFMLMLYRMAGEPTVDPSIATSTYSDVPADHPQVEAIAWATQQGLVQGWPDGTFRPDAAADATALGTVLHRAAGSPAHEAPAESRFTDVSAHVPGYSSLDWLHSVRVLPDHDGDLGVGDGITRAESTSVLRSAVGAGILYNNGAAASDVTTVGEAEATPAPDVSAPAPEPAPEAGGVIQTSPEAQAQAQQVQQGPGGGTAVEVQSVVDGGSTATGDAIVTTAMQGLGGDYVWGGTEFKSWDCSGFTQWVYAQHGMQIPRVTWDQFAAAQPTSTPQPGDLVSQNNGSHVGIYLGDGLMISALNPEQGTMVHAVDAMPVDGYYTYL